MDYYMIRLYLRGYYITYEEHKGMPKNYYLNELFKFYDQVNIQRI